MMQPSQPNLQTQISSQDPLRVPRRQLDPEDLLEIARRNKAWIAGPTLAGLVVAVVVAFLWPDTYVSTAIIRIVPPQVPEKLVPSNVSTDMLERITLMAQTIRSRGTLTSIVETYALYQRQRSQLPLEDIIERMQDDISLSPVRSLESTRSRRGEPLTAFQVSFAYENRFIAQKVTQDITERFISENLRERSSAAAQTTQFLKDQWQGTKNELDIQEQRLTDFRLRYAGQLPDQWPVAVQQIMALEAQITNLNGEIGRHNQEKLMLEAQMRADRDRINNIIKAPTETSSPYADPNLVRLDERVRAAELSLASALESYKPNHPDIQRLQAQIVFLNKERDEYVNSRSQADPDEPVTPLLDPNRAREVRDANSRINNTQVQIRAKEMQINDNVEAIKKINLRISTLQHRVESAPIGEKEYTVLLRDYEHAKRRYDELNLKMAQSEIATDLENRKQGERLELLDAASLPESPTEPKREVIILAGFFVGLFIGGLLVFVKEMKDTSLKTLKDVRAYTQLAILGSVPLLENDFVVMRRRRLSWLAWTTAGLFSAITMAGAVYYYFSTKV